MKTIGNIMTGLLLLAVGLALPFNTLLVDFNTWSSSAIFISKLTCIGGSIAYIIRGVF